MVDLVKRQVKKGDARFINVYIVYEINGNKVYMPIKASFPNDKNNLLRIAHYEDEQPTAKSK